MCSPMISVRSASCTPSGILHAHPGMHECAMRSSLGINFTPDQIFLRHNLYLKTPQSPNAMEAAGVALGVFGAAGILGQLFDGCIKGYRVFSSASNLGRDSERLACKVRIEEVRLSVWGREWGVVEGKFEAHLLAGNWGHEGLKAIATEILSQLLQTIMDCNKLQERYGLKEESPGSVDKEAYKRSADIKNIASGRLKDDWKLKARWVVADKEKFGLLLNDLQYFNDRLEKLFPPARIAALQRTWTNELLQSTQRDVGNLDLLESASSGRYPGLSALAQLKRLRINLDGQEPSKRVLSSSELKIQRWRLTFNEDSEARRVQGIYKRPMDDIKNGSVSEDVPVLIDWIGYEPDMDLDGRLHLYQRVDNLARMLHSGSARHPDLYTLDCVGYVEDSSKNRYGIIHLGPRCGDGTIQTELPPFRSLAALIEDQNSRTPDLDARFRLAKILAIALWSFHSLEWLHKTFCSLNILFFDDAQTTNAEKHSLRSPYVVGFDSSRPDGLAEMTYDAKLGQAQDLYRHPESLGVWRQTYRKSFDIYSLGLALLEIGLWKSVKVIHKPKYSPAVFKEKILQALLPALGSKTGSIYRDVVARCLTYDETNEKHMTPHQVMEWTVSTLEGLKV